MKIAVGTVKGEYDNFDLGDDRRGAPLYQKPVFIAAAFAIESCRGVAGNRPADISSACSRVCRRAAAAVDSCW
jgi:hypothetical protein